MRRALSDGIISAAALLLLLIMLVSVDDRVRERVSGLVGTSSSPSELVHAGQEVTGFANLLFDVVRDQSVSHAPLVIFGVASAVLVIFMVRT
jgi:hypothetical protein